MKFGRKPSIDRQKVQRLFKEGVGATNIARQMNIGVFNSLQSTGRPQNLLFRLRLKTRLEIILKNRLVEK